eukprot:1388049-Rhodomonas_salina.1
MEPKQADKGTLVGLESPSSLCTAPSQWLSMRIPLSRSRGRQAWRVPEWGYSDILVPMAFMRPA